MQTPLFSANLKVFLLDKQVLILFDGARLIDTSFEIKFLCLFTNATDSAPIGIKKSYISLLRKFKKISILNELSKLCLKAYFERQLENDAKQYLKPTYSTLCPSFDSERIIPRVLG